MLRASAANHWEAVYCTCCAEREHSTCSAGVIWIIYDFQYACLPGMSSEGSLLSVLRSLDHSGSVFELSGEESLQGYRM